MSVPRVEAAEFMSRAEIVAEFGIRPDEVTRWSTAGLLPRADRTLGGPGGHVRYRRVDVEAFLAGRGHGAKSNIEEGEQQ